MAFVATAAWSIPRAVSDRFPETGSGLEKYAAVFHGVEVNSTFYRRHQTKTFERWARTVPAHFRFAVKMPRELTHEARMRDIDAPFDEFVKEVSALDDKLGPLLCQMPPSLEFNAADAERAFTAMRRSFKGVIVIEPRHKSWAAQPVREVLQRHAIDRVLADPAPVWSLSDFESAPKYMRLHGTPKIYYSSYDDDKISAFRKRLASDSWCVFDNTASGAAIENALTMQNQMSDAG